MDITEKIGNVCSILISIKGLHKEISLASGIKSGIVSSNG